MLDLVQAGKDKLLLKILARLSSGCTAQLTQFAAEM